MTTMSPRGYLLNCLGAMQKASEKLYNRHLCWGGFFGDEAAFESFCF